VAEGLGVAVALAVAVAEALGLADGVGLGVALGLGLSDGLSLGVRLNVFDGLVVSVAMAVSVCVATASLVSSVCAVPIVSLSSGTTLRRKASGRPQNPADSGAPCRSAAVTKIAEKGRLGTVSLEQIDIEGRVVDGLDRGVTEAFGIRLQFGRSSVHAQFEAPAKGVF